EDDRSPIIIVDFTALTSGRIHNRFDKFSCNDPELKSGEAKQIAADYQAASRSLISCGHAFACGASVWRDAVAKLRDDNPGHFFAPVFPPQSSNKTT
ncbi:unnamed protein product, partial [Phaeothamnion confervicola]